MKDQANPSLLFLFDTPELTCPLAYWKPVRGPFKEIP